MRKSLIIILMTVIFIFGFNSSVSFSDGKTPEDKSKNKNEKDKKKTPKVKKNAKNIMAALYWLRDHQAELGNWSARDFHTYCNNPSKNDKVIYKRNGKCSCKKLKKVKKGKKWIKVKVDDRGWLMAGDGVTGLAVLAFLGAGYTHTEGKFKSTVLKAMRYLLAIQTDDGCFGSKVDEHYTYNHAICTIAVCESYLITGTVKLKGPAQRAIDFIAKAQRNDKKKGYLGWRYGINPDTSDGSLTGWMFQALHVAKMAGLKIPKHCWEGMDKQYKELTGSINKVPKTGYITKAGPNARFREAAEFYTNPTLDAIHVFYRRLTGKSNTDESLKKQSAYITKSKYLPTKSKNKVDFYYWYYGSLAMYQMGGKYWEKWKKAVDKTLTKMQRLENKDECVYGSWDPIDAWSLAGGRVYATAINTLSLLADIRYKFAKSKPKEKSKKDEEKKEK